MEGESDLSDSDHMTEKQKHLIELNHQHLTCREVQSSCLGAMERALGCDVVLIGLVATRLRQSAILPASTPGIP